MPRPRSASDAQILEATIAAIGKHGPARLTLAHVAEEVGLTPAALVQRFGSKAALLAAVAASGTSHADDAFDAALSRSSAPLEVVVEAMVEFAGAIHDRVELANHMAMLQLDLADPELRAHAAEQARVVRRRIRGLLAEAADAGALVHEDLGELADLVHTAYSGALLTWAVDGSGELQEWIRARVTAVLRPYRRA